MMKLNVMLVNEDHGQQAALSSAIQSDGHQVVAHENSTDGLLKQVQRVLPDLLIIETAELESTTLQVLTLLNQKAPLPVVVMTSNNDENLITESIHAGVSAYVVDDARYERIGPIMQAALARFRAFQALRNELDKTKNTLAARKVIDRAKGILMKQRGYDEDEAFHALRKLAMSKNKRLGDMAENIVSAADLLM